LPFRDVRRHLRDIQQGIDLIGLFLADIDFAAFQSPARPHLQQMTTYRLTARARQDLLDIWNHIADARPARQARPRASLQRLSPGG
jgi:hypothetical protein